MSETPQDNLIRRLHDEVARYGVECSQTKELAPRASLVAVFKEIESTLSAAEQRSVTAATVADGVARDAARYRWLREQHEGKLPLENDADGFPMPQEVNALAFTVFYPDPTGDESLIVVPMGSLDETIDAALASGEPK